MSSVEAKIVECTNDDCDRDHVSRTLATFHGGEPRCPDCGGKL